MFWILHFVACLCGFWPLLFTIPAHMIYVAIKGPQMRQGMCLCPDCGAAVSLHADGCHRCGRPKVIRSSGVSDPHTHKTFHVSRPSQAAPRQ